MRRLLAAVLLVLPLSGCVDSEITLDFKDETNVSVVSKMLMSNDMAQMAGISPDQLCQGKPAKAQGEGLLCEDTREMTIDALQAEFAKQDSSNPMADLQNSIKIERADDKTVTVTLDLGGSAALVDEDARMMAKMFVSQGDPSKIALNVKGPKITSTTGTLSEDGKTARFEVTLADLLGGDVPPAFVTTVELSSCTFFIFC